MIGNQILYVEDDPFLGEWVQYELSSEGYDLKLANDGESGINAALSAHQPDLILLDVQLPGMSGYQICKILRNTPQTASIPIVFLTARDSMDDMLLGFDVGGIDYLTKPFSMTELKARVHAHLRQNEQVRKQERTDVAGEIQTTADIQKSMMTRTIPAIDGLDVVAQVQMAQEAGGDFFDFQELPDGRLYMVEADVSGKGLPAALLMSAARSVIRATASQGIGPHQVLTRVNEQLYADLTEVSKFVTVFMGLYSPETRQLRYSNAGHSAAIYRPHDGVARIVEPDNPPVGVLDSYEYLEQSMEFETGDLLVVCSDGYLEATNAKGEMFGLRRMIEQVTALGDRPAQEIADALLAKVTEFAQGIRQFDDQSLVILRGV